MQQSHEMDPLVVASNIYSLLNENSKMRVFRVTFQPGDYVRMHHHPDHMVYVLKGGKIRITTEKDTQDMELKEGAVVFLDAQNHEATNLGKTSIELLVVELKS